MSSLNINGISGGIAQASFPRLTSLKRDVGIPIFGVTKNQVFAYLNEENKIKDNVVNVGFVDNLENVTDGWDD